MPALALSGLSETVGSNLFGGNILAHRDSLAPEAQFDRLVDELGVTALRYPGGSLTEAYFDLAAPDAPSVTNRDTGEAREFIPISDFLEFAAAEGLPVTLVIPTRDQLSADTDAHGDRFAAIDEETLRGFVADTVAGRYGDAEIQAFEIGNEYWGSGQMSATEYGRLASSMAEIVDDELARLAPDHPGAGGIEIVIQMGTNFGESSLDEEFDELLTAGETLGALNERFDLELDESVLRGNGDVDWIAVNNLIILSYFDEQTEVDAIDGIVAHVYSKEPAVEDQRSLMLHEIAETWGEDPRFDELGLYVTEWNQSGQTAHFERDEDYGLYQAHEMLNLVEEFARVGVDQAHVWPLLQNSDNALSMGHSHEELSPAGQFFSMMSERLPGKAMLDFNPDDTGETEAQLPAVDVHGFYGHGEFVFYIASTSETPAETLIDTSQLFLDPGLVTARRLGVEEGDAPGSNSAAAQVETLDPDEVMQHGYIVAQLGSGEILEVTVNRFTPTEDMELLLAETVSPSQSLSETLRAEQIEAPQLDDAPAKMAPSPELPVDPVALEGDTTEQAPDTPGQGDAAAAPQSAAATPFAAASADAGAAIMAALATQPVEQGFDPGDPEDEEGGDDGDDGGMGGLFWALLPLLALAGLS